MSWELRLEQSANIAEILAGIAIVYSVSRSYQPTPNSEIACVSQHSGQSIHFANLVYAMSNAQTARIEEHLVAS